MNNHWHKCLANCLNNYLSNHIITLELMDKTNLSQTGIARLMLREKVGLDTHTFLLLTTIGGKLWGWGVSLRMKHPVK